jgi:hypothetical protein
MCIKNKKLLDVFNKTLAFQIKVVLKVSWSLHSLLVYILIRHSKCFQLFFTIHSYIYWLRVVIYPSLFNISKHSFCFRTQHIKHNHASYGGRLIVNAPSQDLL